MKYFAYGSNMNPAWMRGRCPDAHAVGVGALSRHRFIINRRGVATVVPDAASTAYGVIWDVSGLDVESLDRAEGVASGIYARRTLGIGLVRGGMIEAVMYEAADQQAGVPRNGYLDRVIEGAEKFGFPEGYLEELRRWLAISC